MTHQNNILESLTLDNKHAEKLNRNLKRKWFKAVNSKEILQKWFNISPKTRQKNCK